DAGGVAPLLRVDSQNQTSATTSARMASRSRNNSARLRGLTTNSSPLGTRGRSLPVPNGKTASTRRPDTNVIRSTRNWGCHIRPLNCDYRCGDPEGAADARSATQVEQPV